MTAPAAEEESDLLTRSLTPHPPFPFDAPPTPSSQPLQPEQADRVLHRPVQPDRPGYQDACGDRRAQDPNGRHEAVSRALGLGAIRSQRKQGHPWAHPSQFETLPRARASKHRHVTHAKRARRERTHARGAQRIPSQHLFLFVCNTKIPSQKTTPKSWSPTSSYAEVRMSRAEGSSPRAMRRSRPPTTPLPPTTRRAQTDPTQTTPFPTLLPESGTQTQTEAPHRPRHGARGARFVAIHPVVAARRLAVRLHVEGAPR